MLCWEQPVNSRYNLTDSTPTWARLSSHLCAMPMTLPGREGTAMATDLKVCVWQMHRCASHLRSLLIKSSWALPHQDHRQIENSGWSEWSYNAKYPQRSRPDTIANLVLSCFCIVDVNSRFKAWVCRRRGDYNWQCSAQLQAFSWNRRLQSEMEPEGLLCALCISPMPAQSQVHFSRRLPYLSCNHVSLFLSSKSSFDTSWPDNRKLVWRLGAGLLILTETAFSCIFSLRQLHPSRR